MGLNPGEGMDICKYLVPLWHGGTLNSRRAASLLVRLVKRGEWWIAPDHFKGVLSQNWGGTEANRTATSAKRYQANGSHCEAMVVLTCPKSIPKINLVPTPKYNTVFVGFTRVNNQEERNTSKQMHKSIRVEECNKISIDETTTLVKSLPNMLREL
ncbi:hypothetical protein TNCV_862601 [Trichonephila clavipes]|nr:hypothetical protein TNCV_862601 [Trichonephila clavipes]